MIEIPLPMVTAELRPSYKRELVRALRSGEYLQTIGRLRRGDTFCALGVAADVLEDAWWVWSEIHGWSFHSPGVTTVSGRHWFKPCSQHERREAIRALTILNDNLIGPGGSSPPRRWTSTPRRLMRSARCSPPTTGSARLLNREGS